MADQTINALSTKTAPETSDQLLLVGTGEPQLIDYDKLADAILNKITSKNYALDAGTMTLPEALNALNGKTSKFAADDCDNAWEQFTQNTSGKNGVLLGYGTIKGQTVTIIANKYDRGSSNYVGHMLTQDHIYVNNHYNSENHEKILV